MSLTDDILQEKFGIDNKISDIVRSAEDKLSDRFRELD